MTTQLETKPGVPKYEAFVDNQLARVRTRIRALDAGRSAMMLGVVTLAYFLLSAAFDLAVKGADEATVIRLAAFGVYAVVMVCLVGQLGLRLYRRVNPYYAAKQLEDTIPGAKNSVINWLDLKAEQLPGAIRSAVGQRAARELTQTDPDKAIDTKGNWVLGGVLAALAVGLLILFALGPNQFGSLWQRAFTPFITRNIDSKAKITLVRPEAGNATVPLNQRVEFQAQIDGRFPKAGQPGAPRLLYRYQPSDQYVPLAMEYEDIDGKWNATILGDQVRNGFWYKLAAGDTETPEYQVKVQSMPQATRFEATYHYRPYRKLADEKVIFPNEHAVIPRLRDYRGTEVELVVRTNRELRAARVEVETNGVKQELPGEILPDDRKSLKVRLTLEQRGTFRVYFTSRAGEENIDRSLYQIEVLDDETPRVVLTKPAQDVSLAVGGTLPLEGSAQDDIGIKSMALRLQVLEGGPPLQPQVYRQGTSFQFDNGTYPDFLEYKDFVALDKVATTKGESLPLKAGMVLEYWLEATDNSDYPSKDGNVGKSQAFKITIVDKPPDDKKQQEERKKAEKQQKDHEQKQDQKNSKENQKRNGNQGNDESKNEDKKKDEFEKNLEKVKQALNNDKQDQQKGESKAQEPKSGENKPGNNGDSDKADQKGADSPNQAGEKKDDGKQGQGSKAAEAKDQGGKDQGEQKPSETKGPGAGEKKSAAAKGNDNKSDPGDKGAAKEQSRDQPGQAKNEGQPGAEQPSKAKGNDGGNPGASGQAKGPKDGPGDNPPQAKGDKEGGGGHGDTKPESKGVAKEQAGQAKSKGDQGSPTEAGQAKDGPPSQSQPQGQAKGNDDGNKADTKAGGQNPQLGNKDASAKKSDTQAAIPKGADPKAAKDSGTSKDDPRADTNPRAAAKEDIAKLIEKLNNQDQAKEAVKELSRLAKEAKDPEVRKAAEEVLDKINKQAKASSDPIPKDKKTSEGPAQAGPKNGNQEGSEAAKADASKNGEATGKGAQDGKDPQKTKPGDQAGNFGEGGKGITDDITPKPPNADFAKRGSGMQLEDLKKRVTPEILKKLNWSESDWQQFLKDAKAYQERSNRQTMEVNGSKKKGQTSQLPGTGLRQIDGKPNEQVDTLQADRALPPPEFRDAQRQFTTSPPGKK
jgi:collagen type III alpha